MSRFDRPPPALGYVGQVYAARGWSSLPWLWRLRTSTLVMTGDDDPIIPVVNGRVLAGLIPDSTLHIVKDEGHLILLEQADRSTQVIDEFLGRDA